MATCTAVLVLSGFHPVQARGHRALQRRLGEVPVECPEGIPGQTYYACDPADPFRRKNYTVGEDFALALAIGAVANCHVPFAHSRRARLLLEHIVTSLAVATDFAQATSSARTAAR